MANGKDKITLVSILKDSNYNLSLFAKKDIKAFKAKIKIQKGNPYDNATAESFFKTLKAEEVYLWEYRTFADVQERIPYFLEAVYNRKRLHSSLGYLPPEEFEKRLLFKEQKNLPARPGYSNLSVQG